MSLRKYLKPSGSGCGGTTNPLLSDPNEGGESIKMLVSTVNEHVAKAMSATSSRKRSSSYNRYEL